MPSLLPQVQERLLESISLVLAKAPYRPSKAGAPVPRIPSAPSTPVGSEYVGPALTQLALQTLTNFDLQVCFSFASVEGFDRNISMAESMSCVLVR